MVDPLPRLASLKDSYRELGKARKNHIKLSFSILLLGLGLFFYFVSEPSANAEKMVASGKISLETVDPLNWIGKGIAVDACKKESCNGDITRVSDDRIDPQIPAMLAGSPMAQMAAYLGKIDPKVSAYLVAIARKESSWGQHAPSRSGHDCYNYWGYKGSYHLTESGYSCFDSPEQAVQEVGGRINKLLAQNINTPEKMVVWKCGATCAGQDPQAVQKWISDVRFIYNKLQK